MAVAVNINCPCCGAEDALYITIDPGEKGSRPSMYDPGSPDFSAGVDDIEYDCDCHDFLSQLDDPSALLQYDKLVDTGAMNAYESKCNDEPDYEPDYSDDD